jgi:hypothetical protein
VPKAESPDCLIPYRLPRYLSVWLFLFRWYDRLHPCEVSVQVDRLPRLLHLPVLVVFSEILEVGDNSVTEITVDIVAGTERSRGTGSPSEDSTADDFQGYAVFVKGSPGSP